MNNFYVTFTGERVTPEDLGDLRINLIDIAHHLTNIQRFGGALPFDKSYSVAEHCILLAEYALAHNDYEAARMCLLHDASEAYLGDVVSALKASLPDYRELEGHLETMIYNKYNIDTSHHQIVKALDMQILIDEVKALLPNRLHIFETLYPTMKGLGVKISGETNKTEVNAKYLELCKVLDIEDNDYADLRISV